jgi:hypothetical protein
VVVIRKAGSRWREESFCNFGWSTPVAKKPKSRKIRLKAAVRARKKAVVPAAAPNDAIPVKRKPRMKMSDAMRSVGLDELKVAGMWNRLLDRLDVKGNEKPLLEALKEYDKIFDAYPAPRAGASQDAAPMQFVASVPRPVRSDAQAPRAESPVGTPGAQAESVVASAAASQPDATGYSAAN